MNCKRLIYAKNKSLIRVVSLDKFSNNFKNIHFLWHLENKIKDIDNFGGGFINAITCFVFSSQLKTESSILNTKLRTNSIRNTNIQTFNFGFNFSSNFKISFICVAIKSIIILLQGKNLIFLPTFTDSTVGICDGFETSTFLSKPLFLFGGSFLKRL